MTKKSALQRLLNEPVGKQTQQFLLVSEHFELIHQLIEAGQSYKRICDCLREDGHTIHQQTLKRHYLNLKQNPSQRGQGQQSQRAASKPKQTIAPAQEAQKPITLADYLSDSGQGRSESPSTAPVNEQEQGPVTQQEQHSDQPKTAADYLADLGQDFDASKVVPPPPLVPAEIVDG